MGRETTYQYVHFSDTFNYLDLSDVRVVGNLYENADLLSSNYCSDKYGRIVKLPDPPEPPLPDPPPPPPYEKFDLLDFGDK